MIVDGNTHLGWYPDHFGQEFVEEAMRAKRAKRRVVDDVYFAGDDHHGADARPEAHLQAVEGADKCIVMNFKFRTATYVHHVPIEVVYEHVQRHPGRMAGYVCIDPLDDDHLEQLERAVEDLGMAGVKLGPVYQHFDPTDRRYFPLYERIQKYGLVLMWHQGTTFVRDAPLKYANPVLLEEVALAFPDLRMVITHLGHPWEVEAISVIRKQPNVFGDISALHYRPWRYYNAMMAAVEYGVADKLLLASDWPSATTRQVINGLQKINDVVGHAGLPRISDEVIHNIIHENWRSFYGEGFFELRGRR